MRGGPSVPAHPDPVQLQRGGEPKGDVHQRGHGQLPGGVRAGAQDGAHGHLPDQDEGDPAQGDLCGHRHPAAQGRVLHGGEGTMQV